jgi:Sulfotransferase family
MAFENRYSAFDRLLHKLAFSTRKAQIGLADIEEIIFRNQIACHELDRPLFVTALPRAGTTLLLEVCVASGEFASHTYRNMPFVLIPMLWNRFSEGFRRSDVPMERAHGDGMLISVDSPEAFEESVWIAFWPDRYKRDRIMPWREEEDGTFRAFLENHFKKIVALSAPEGNGMAALPSTSRRYVSKNNLNIARITWLARNFRDALFLIPFREPIQHCASLLHQHLNFLEIHRRDRFAKRYMEGIGHFDFGDNLRPVDFDGWLGSSKHRDPTKMNFWVEYWLATYRSLIEETEERVRFLNYDGFCADPLLGLERVANFIDVENNDKFLGQAERIHAPSFYEIDCASLEGTIVEEAKAMYSRLAAFSIV